MLCRVQSLFRDKSTGHDRTRFDYSRGIQYSDDFAKNDYNSVKTRSHTIRVLRTSGRKRKVRAVALAAVFQGLALCTQAPCLADEVSLDFFKFKSSDFFVIDDKRSDEKKKEEEEEREDERRRKLDSKWANRPDNPKHAWQETFVDSDFSMHTFQDLDVGDLNRLAAMRDRRDDTHRDDDEKKDEEDLDVDKSDRDDYRKRMKKDDFRKFRDLTAPIPGMLHDWVPSKPDRGQNGAFTGAPDNGAVVPYKLNGWVEIQRKLPWEAEP